MVAAAEVVGAEVADWVVEDWVVAREEVGLAVAMAAGWVEADAEAAGLAVAG